MKTGRICKVMRLIGFYLCAAMVLLLLIPLLAGILNIGNASGMVFFSLLGLYCLFYERVHAIIARLWHHTAGKCGLLILAAVGTLAVLTVALTGILMIRAAYRKPAENATVVVLGCQVRGSVPSLMLTERLEAATEYLREHPQAKCIVSGGQGVGEDISEAECMQRYLIAQGIDAARIYKEDQSTSTRENIAFSAEIIRREGCLSEIALVTNEFHQYRASRIAEKLGLSAGAVNGKTAPWLIETYVLREMFGIVYEWVL